ncbi:hypothetical protein GF324_08485, partial [bacterium]|nr:hypothetical protein [bacterium]
MTWSLSESIPWLTAQSEGGTLASLESTTNTLTAENYPGEGTYTGTVQFDAPESTPTSVDLGVTLNAFNAWTEHPVTEEFNRPESIDFADIDGDGDNDLAGAGNDDFDLIWFENLDGTGTTWSEHPIAVFSGAGFIRIADVDGDGDMDFVGGGRGTGAMWWENTDGSGLNLTEHTIVSDTYVYGMEIADFDEDEDLDVVIGNAVADEVTWMENADGSGTSWTSHVVDDAVNGAQGVQVADLDGDDDLDILGLARHDGDILWWENTDGAASTWTRHTIESEYSSPSFTGTADLDGDGDLDVFSGYGGTIQGFHWWENMDGAGTSWTMQTVDTGYSGPASMTATDFDNDGDVDLFGADYQQGVIRWENVDGTGTNWLGSPLVFDLRVYDLEVADIDGDSDSDVLGASLLANKIAWWEQPGVGSVPPDAFTLTSPADGTVSGSETVTLEWEEATDPDPGDIVTYTVYVSETEGELGTAVATDLSTTSYEFTAVDDTQYWWTVEAVDSYGTGTLADVTWNFSTYIEEPPSAFDLVSPADGASLDTQTPTLSWGESTDPDPDDEVTYTLYWSVDDPGFTAPESVNGLTETSYTFESVDQLTGNGDGGRDGRAGVDRFGESRDGRAGVNRHGNGPVSFEKNGGTREPVTFQMSKDTGRATASSRLDPRTGGQRSSRAGFSSGSGLRSDDRSAFPDGRGDTGEGRSLDELSDDITVYWYVVAHDGDTDGTPSNQNPDDGTTWSFGTAVPEPPADFALNAPADGSVESSTEVVLSWGESIDPDPGDEVSYEVYVWTEGESMPDEPEAVVTDESYTFTGDDDQAYEWTVYAVDTQDHATAAENGPFGYSIYIPEAPSAFNLTSPEDGTTVGVLNPTLNWEASSDPDPDNTVTYMLEYAFNADFTDATTHSGLTTNSYMFEEEQLLGEFSEWWTRHGMDELLPDDVTVYWRVLAEDANTPGTWSNGGADQFWSFDVYFEQSPNAFALSTPSDGEVLAATTIDFEWSEAVDPDPNDESLVVYDLYIWLDGEAMPDEASESGLDATTFEWTGGEDDTAYEWQVIARDPQGNETEASNGPSGFSIYIPEAPTAFNLVLPVDGTTFDDQ